MTQMSLRTRRAVAPIIATLLLVAIVAVGAGVIFAFSQGFFSEQQISSVGTIESLTVTGYDARDIADILREKTAFICGKMTSKMLINKSCGFF